MPNDFSRSTAVTDSSQIWRVEYSPSTKVMSVQFANGDLYLYEGVSGFVYATIVGADSVGKAFNAVKNDFKGKKVS
jgi:hypothetical protein